MNKKWSQIISGFQFFLLSFLLVCYFGYEKLIIPEALIMLGRVHPLVLHLPIGMFFGSVLILFTHPKQKQVFDLLFQTTVLVAIITAIAGLFLSKETSYDEAALSLHRHTGIIFTVILYVGGLIKMDRHKYLTYIFIGVVTLLLIISSHLGAEITHGKNFLIPQNDKARILNACTESSNVYETIVYPILEQKCISCHKVGKTKGGLIMTDTLSIIKGGENGPILNQKNLSESILLDVLTLPIEEERHMPPEGKGQLTVDELEILKSWILHGNHFDACVNDYVGHPTIQEKCQEINAKHANSSKYNFSAADANLIKQISTEYLSINPLSIESPALAAQFFVASAYSSKSLQQLQKLKTQLVSLNLSFMPLAEKDWTLLSDFTNLENLNLNFTSFNEDQFHILSNLPSLKTLSINGTPAVGNAGKYLGSITQLENLHLGYVTLSPLKIEEWQQEFPQIKIHATYKSEEILPLTTPIIKNAKSIYEKGDSIYLLNKIENTTMRYTLDGSDPDSLRGIVYEEPIPVKKILNLKAISTKEGWKQSPILSHTGFIKGSSPDSIALHSKPNANYPGQGKNTFFDQEIAEVEVLKNNKWVGFREEPLVIEIFFDQPKAIDTIAVSYGIHIPSYVFPPYKSTIDVYDQQNTRIKHAKTTHPKIDKSNPNDIRKGFYAFTIKQKMISRLKIKIEGLSHIPDWHPGKGQKSWLFVDEIFIYN